MATPACFLQKIKSGWCLAITKLCLVYLKSILILFPLVIKKADNWTTENVSRKEAVTEINFCSISLCQTFCNYILSATFFITSDLQIDKFLQIRNDLHSESHCEWWLLLVENATLLSRVQLLNTIRLSEVVIRSSSQKTKHLLLFLETILAGLAWWLWLCNYGNKLN